MKNKNKLVKTLCIIMVCIAIIAGVSLTITYNISNSTVKPSQDDVQAMIEALTPYGITAGVVVSIFIILIVAVCKLKKKLKFIIRSQATVALIIFVCVLVNLISFGPAYSILSLSLGNTYSISEETFIKSEELCEEIVEEGIVLLKNENNTLPLASSENKLNVFGWSSINPVYGGTGSGAINEEDCITLLEGLENAGFELNTELSDFYQEYRGERPEVEMGSQDWTVPEPTITEYDEAGIFENAKEFSDVALIVISRSGGENADLPMSIKDEDTIEEGGIFGLTGVRYSSNQDDIDTSKHYLELSNREIAMVERITAEFENVIVVINSANPMELGWIDEYDNINGVVWCPGTGQTGFNGLGSVLSGDVNPSGRLVDTYVYDLLSTPIVNNFGDFQYDNMTDIVNAEGADTSFNATFVNYVEGIYVGYKFYETADAEGIIDYESVVQFPFGYGLSYTSFSQDIELLNYDGETVEIEVKVTNTGKVSGKEVVQVYYTPPYYNEGIEKAEVNLIEFTKTNTLAPGESEVVVLEFNVEDMASYDYINNEAYVLEKGDYLISIRKDSHTVIDSEVITLTDDIIYNEANDGSRESDEIIAENQFDFALGEITYLSRKDSFENYEIATAAPSSYSMANEARNSFLSIANYNPEDYNDPNDVMPLTKVDSGLEIRDMIGLDYDDEKWEDLLNQLSIEDMNNLIAIGGYQTVALKSINLPSTVECDGPASIYNNFTGQGGTAFPSPILLAATWNKELARERGELMGLQCEEMNVSGWYGPAMNIHRSAFSGRNFEYYSEDGVLSGYIALNEVIGASKYNVATYIKHFALNDQEENRKSLLCTWSNEQAIREIYLKPFEMVVKEGKSTAVMSSFNYIGNQYAGASSALLQTVLRNEWGFNGVVVTDWFSGFRDGYMDADMLVRSGNDRMLSTTGQSGAVVDDTTSATSVIAMRTASHNILYSLANSNAMDDNNFALATWIKIFIIVNVLIGVAVIALEIVLVKKIRKYSDDSIIVENV